MCKTKEEILENLLSCIDPKYDKRAGTLIHDLMAAESIEKEKLYQEIDNLKKKLDVRNLVDSEVDLYISQNSDLSRHPATHAEVVLKVVGSGVIKKGDVFETMTGTQFESTEEKVIAGVAMILANAVLPGHLGNVMSETITQIPVTLQGITGVSNSAAASGGYDQEKDKDFINRFLSTQQEEVTQGNKASYKIWCSEVKGVGGVKVFPLQDAQGNHAENCTQIVIIDSGNSPASQELVEKVQTHLNPLDHNGHGEGMAPLGAYVYVKAATALVVNVSMTLAYKVGYNEDLVKPLLEKSLDNYIKSIAFKENSVSHAKVSNAVFTTEGIEDYLDLKLNGLSSNIAINEKSVVTLGVVTIA